VIRPVTSAYPANACSYARRRWIAYGKAPQPDALKPIKLLHDPVKDTVSVFKKFKKRMGQLYARFLHSASKYGGEGLTKACSWLPTASAPLPLPAAADAGRYAASDARSVRRAMAAIGQMQSLGHRFKNRRKWTFDRVFAAPQRLSSVHFSSGCEAPGEQVLG
jgi:hypothetical protein